MTRLLFTGDGLFLRRHRLLLEAIEARGFGVSMLAQDERTTLGNARYLARAAAFGVRALVSGGRRGFSARPDPAALRVAFDRSSGAFTFKSREIEARIGRCEHGLPQGVVHIFGLSSPFPTVARVPYAHYLDYTYALALRSKDAVLGYVRPMESERFLDGERLAYERAARIFTMSRLVRDSVVNDYGIAPERVEIVGAGPNLLLDPTIAKTFGTHQLLFNASDFTRKGGALVFDAFDRVRRANTRATLVVVGGSIPHEYAGRDGVDERGRVSAATMRELYAGSSLVLAPAANDPFPGVAIEAMSHGTPVIVRDRDGMPEIVTAGHDGIVLSESEASPEFLSQTILELTSDEGRLRRLSAAALQTVAERLNWNVVAQKMEPFFRSL